MDVVRYGVIGCGMMGQEHLRAIGLLPRTEVVAYVEPDDAMAAAARSLTPGAQKLPDADTLLARDDIDCVLIASPNHIHVDQLEALARHRAVPVLVEKPLFVDRSERARIDAIAASYPAPIWVAMEYRFMPPIAEFLKAAETATGGIKMLTIREHRYPFLDKVGGWNRFNRLTGGTFVEKCCHFFDLMRLVLQSEPVRVMASGAQDVNHLDERIDGAVPDVFDNGYVIVEFESGARAMLDLCMFAEGAEYQEVL
ncbi:MAG: Gfo/Idh/MocA family oxidoreductase, partial [Pseudomonadota bacterium]